VVLLLLPLVVVVVVVVLVVLIPEEEEDEDEGGGTELTPFLAMVDSATWEQDHCFCPPVTSMKRYRNTPTILMLCTS
jgi:hypothetical protein